MQVDVGPLKQAFRSGLDARGQSKLSQLLSAACFLHPENEATSRLTGTMLLPVSTLIITPLFSKRLCDVPLAQSLVLPSPPSHANQLLNGFVTMDQARSLLPLAADDSNVSYGLLPCRALVLP